jgi:hypothetical protein
LSCVRLVLLTIPYLITYYSYARDLCDVMGVDKAGLPQQTQHVPPCFGAAADGDADRNMILGECSDI